MAGAVLVLVALLVGVPVVLAAVAGWPLPTAWPNGDQVRFAARGGLGDTAWLKIFALVVWLAWAQLVVAVLRELVAVARHRTRPARSGWAPALAGRLVGALLVSSGAVGHVPHALSLASAVAPPSPVAVPSPLAVPTVAASVAALAAPAVPMAQHVVVRGESLSSIARDELGTPAAWPFLWETNKGRSFGERVFEDPNLILPGWDLDVPGPAAAPVAPVLIPPVVVAAPSVAPPVARVTPDRVTRPVTPPDVAEHAGAVEATADVGTVIDATVDVDVNGAVDEGAPAWARFTAFTGAALLATGAVGMLRSSRRRTLRPLTRAVTVPRAEGELAEVVTALVAGTDAVAMARLELALRAVAGRLGRSAAEARVLAVRRTSDAIEVVLDRPAALELPWRAGTEDGRTWGLPASVPLHELTDDARAVAPPCPALVGLGHDEGGAEVFVDLEAAGVLDLGALASGPDAARHVAATLAVTPLADELRVVTVGEVLPDLAGRHEVRAMADLRGVVAEIEAMTAPIAAATGGDRSTFRLRSVAGHEPWEPVIVILTDPPSPQDPSWDALITLVFGNRGVAVVGAGVPEATLVAADDGAIRVGRWTVRPHGLDDAGAALLAAALEEPPVDLIADEFDDGTENVEDEPAPEDDHPWTLMVRVLGPVDVVSTDGMSAEFERPKALELVVWLAQHRHSATRTGARAALWEADVSNASFSNVVSEARRALAGLAAPPTGEEWVARTYAERLPLHAEVVLDADIVRSCLSRAQHLPDDEAIEELRGALSLVRGVPYSGRCYLWPDAEALPATLTLLVTTVAVELGRRLLDRDEVDEVLQVTAVGLEVLPGHEELVGLRLRAHAARGDRAALRHEYACYEQSLLADPWAGDPSPTLVALRQELLTPVAGS